MKVVIVSDTHMPKRGNSLPGKLLKELETADHIIHAGDWSTIGTYEKLVSYAPVTGVHGNVEENGIMDKFPDKQLLTLNGYTIGIVHGHGSGKTTERRAFDSFMNDDVDIIVFGHSHIPLLRYFKKRLLINPGSPTDKRTHPYYSFVVMNLGDELNVSHIFFSEKQ